MILIRIQQVGGKQKEGFPYLYVAGVLQSAWYMADTDETSFFETDTRLRLSAAFTRDRD